MANISRNTYNESKQYDKVILQQGIPVVDADWNELNDNERVKLRRIVQDAIGEGYRPGDVGYKIEESSSPVNNFKIREGEYYLQGFRTNLLSEKEYNAQLISEFCVVTAISGNVLTISHKNWVVDDLIGSKYKFTSGALATNEYAITDNTANTITLDTDVETAGAIVDDLGQVLVHALTTPTGNRTDKVYLDLWEEEITGKEDTNIVNPTLNVESTRRMQIRAVVRVAEGGSVPSDVSGHYYTELASLARLDANSSILTAMITDSRKDFTSLESLHDEIQDARGDKNTLDERLGISLNEDGTLKSAVSSANTLNVGADLDNNEADSYVAFSVDGNEKMRLDDSGQLGIGTESPSNKLSLVGNVDITGKIITGVGSIVNPAYTFVGDENTGMYSSSADTLSFSTSGLHRMTIFGSGDIEIRKSLYIMGGDILNRKGNATQPSYSFWDDLNTGIFSSDPDSLNFATGGQERLRIDSSGNVGIGTESPDASSILELLSNSKGLLVPRMTTTQRDAISSPADGLLIYNTTTNSLNQFISSSWVDLGLIANAETIDGIHASATPTANYLVALDANKKLPPSIGLPQWYKVTKTYSDLAFAGLTNDIEVHSLPAGAIIHGIKIKHSASFSGGGIVSYNVSVGIAGVLEKYASKFNVFQAASDTSMQLSNNFGTENHGSLTSIRIAAECSGANLDQAGSGSVDIWLLISIAV